MRQSDADVFSKNNNKGKGDYSNISMRKSSNEPDR